MRTHRAVVIGAGVGGLVAALDLALNGLRVDVVERASAPGGKMREIDIAGSVIDAGPTVFTMRWVFEEIFAAAGTSLDAELTLKSAEILARHAWNDRERLDLFADINRSTEAIAEFAGAAEARRFRAFSQRARQIYQTLENPFLRAQRPDSPMSLMRRTGLQGIGGLMAGAPFSTLWHELGKYFHDPRLRQLFGRYATYCGSSPFQAPAMLMLVAHVERQGVWLVDGGMHRIVRALAKLCAAHGVNFHYGTEAAEVTVSGARATGVRLASGDKLDADCVVSNADCAAISSGLLGKAVARAVPREPISNRSLSAITWAMSARTEGFPLIRHNVFFSNDYQAEFNAIFGRSSINAMPTVYVCAQDRLDTDSVKVDGAERLLCIINAPARGDTHSFTASEIGQCETRTFEGLKRCGLFVDRSPASTEVTTPEAFNRLFPATGGALYGTASHGWQASFRRPGSRTPIKGLYLAGGGSHPGPGVPMAALSGRLAASSVIADLASTSRSVPVATAGGMLTRSATTDAMV